MSEEKQQLLSNEELERVVGGVTLLSPMLMQTQQLNDAVASNAANANACAAATGISGSRPIPFI